MLFAEKLQIKFSFLSEAENLIIRQCRSNIPERTAVDQNINPEKKN